MSLVKVKRLKPIWQSNKTNAWESGLTPQDIYNHLVGKNDLIDSEEPDLVSVIWWIETLSAYPNGGEVPDKFNIFLDEDGEVVDGYHRLTAAMFLNFKTFPVIEAHNFSNEK